jgi:spore coat protein CotH
MRLINTLFFRTFTLSVISMLLVGLFEPAHAKNKINGERLLSANHIVDVDIELPDADWKKLCAQSRDMGSFFSGAPVEKVFDYFEATVSIDGTKIKSVGIRKKGLFGSLDNRRPSLKIKFDEFVKQDPVKGLSRLTLNNNKQDTSLVSQYLTYKLFRDAGIHAPRSNFARVSVNGEYLGIYTNVESVKKPFLERSFGNKTGKLYEGTLTDFYPKTVDKIEAKTNAGEKDRRDVVRLAGLLAAEGDLNIKELEQLVDLDNFLRFWAMEGLCRMWDGYSANQNNFFFYVNPSNNRGYFIPWGADSSFSRNGGPFARFGNQDGPTAIYAESMLANRLYNSKGMPDRYRAAMEKLLDDIWNEKKLIAEVDRLEKFLTPHLGDSQQYASREMDNVRDFITSRREVVNKELVAWPARLASQPRKPMYTVSVGSMNGSFQTSWASRPPREPAKMGEAGVEIKLDGELVAFKQLGSGAWPNPMARFGRRGPGPSRPSINLVFTGIREAGSELLSISLTIDRQEFENAKSGSALNVNGRLTVGRGAGFGGFGGFGGGPMRSVNGKLVLTKTGTQEGDSVAGRVDMDIVEVHGGFFDRRRGAGRSRQGGGRPGLDARTPRSRWPAPEADGQRP